MRETKLTLKSRTINVLLLSFVAVAIAVVFAVVVLIKKIKIIKIIQKKD